MVTPLSVYKLKVEPTYSLADFVLFLPTRTNLTFPQEQAISVLCHWIVEQRTNDKQYKRALYLLWYQKSQRITRMISCSGVRKRELHFSDSSRFFAGRYFRFAMPLQEYINQDEYDHKIGCF